MQGSFTLFFVFHKHDFSEWTLTKHLQKLEISYFDFPTLVSIIIGAQGNPACIVIIEVRKIIEVILIRCGR